MRVIVVSRLANFVVRCGSRQILGQTQIELRTRVVMIEQAKKSSGAFSLSSLRGVGLRLRARVRGRTEEEEARRTLRPLDFKVLSAAKPRLAGRFNLWANARCVFGYRPRSARTHHREPIKSAAL